jgi:hypothetical protein
MLCVSLFILLRLFRAVLLSLSQPLPYIDPTSGGLVLANLPPPMLTLQAEE